RGRQRAAIRESGVRIKSPRGDLHLYPVRATQDPAAIGPVDLVLFTVKLWSTEEAGQALRPLIGRDTAVVSLQNGVDANDVLARLVGREHLMGGVCYIAATLDRPGLIQHTGQMARLAFGEPGAVGRAQSVELDADHAEKRLAFVDTLPAEMTSSMHRDLEQGNRLEVAWLSGTVARLGRDLGVPTPANRAVYTALKLHAAGR